MYNMCNQYNMSCCNTILKNFSIFIGSLIIVSMDHKVPFKINEEGGVQYSMLSLPISEVCGSNWRPYVRKLVVAYWWPTHYSAEFWATSIYWFRQLLKLPVMI